MHSPSPGWVRHVPNTLTWLRIAAIPPVVLCMLQGGAARPGEVYAPVPAEIWGAGLFALAAATDFLDGWFARRYQVETLLGKLLDPLADKLLVVSALIILVEKQRVPGWVVVILIVRDLAINALRLSALQDNFILPSSWGGKLKTGLQDVAIACLTVHGTLFGFLPLLEIGHVALWGAVVASVWSAGAYILGMVRHSKAS